MEELATKALLRKLGEETIYSAKGHFKACDVRRQAVTYVLMLCAILNVIGIIGTEPRADKIISATGLLGTIFLLIWNEGEGKHYRARHKTAGEDYLALHKQIRICFFLARCDGEEVKELNLQVTNLDKSDRPDIPGIAKWLAKRAIITNGETDNWFLK